jgi:protein-S-isoprenylcysteine O-methyltransferase Ste14
MAGVGLALQSCGAVLLSLIIFGLAFGNRIRLEEKVLVSLFGDKYVQYMKKTKMLIPLCHLMGLWVTQIPVRQLQLQGPR